MVGGGAAESLTLISVIPLLDLINGGSFKGDDRTEQLLENIVTWTGADELAAAAGLFCLCAITAGAVRLFVAWLSASLTATIGSDLSCRTFRCLVTRSYADYIESNSKEGVATISSYIGAAVGMINSFLNMMTGLVVCTLLGLSLVAINGELSIWLIGSFGIIYLLLGLKIRKRLVSNGEKIAHASRELVGTIQEALGGYRDIRLSRTEDVFCSIYAQTDKRMRNGQAENAFIGAAPRFVLESFGLVIIVVIGVTISQYGDSTSTITLLGTALLATQKILPALQQVFSNWSQIKGQRSGAGRVTDILSKALASDRVSREVMSFNDRIRLENVTFAHRGEVDKTIKGVSLEVKKGTIVGLVGETGSGKSTLVDLIMCLLEVSEGFVWIDNKKINGRGTSKAMAEAWRNCITHVPQSVFLLDTTIESNIAFGSCDSIDRRRIQWAAKMALIDEFIESQRNGYKSNVGERGIKLSGGQRQRLAIARALYRGGSVLILDEATSALDRRTEEMVIKNICRSKEDMTVIMITHREESLKICDRVFRLDNGRLVT